MRGGGGGEEEEEEAVVSHRLKLEVNSVLAACTESKVTVHEVSLISVQWSVTTSGV